MDLIWQVLSDEEKAEIANQVNLCKNYFTTSGDWNQYG